MYTPPHFQVTETEEIFAFIEANGFGTLVSQAANHAISVADRSQQTKNRTVASHLPFLLSEDRARLFGHLAAQNPQCSADLENQESLIILQGPHDYISPSWYTKPGVPTWNYQAVHLYGRCRLIHDHERKRQLVEQLTHKYESAMTSPWQPTYPAAMLQAIIGIEFEIEEIECKYKLSQNRPADDRQQVIDQLETGNSTALAEAMKRNEPGSRSS